MNNGVSNKRDVRISRENSTEDRINTHMASIYTLRSIIELYN